MVLTQLNTFVRIVDAGGITRAAEQIGLTQPAVTKQLRSLETEFSTPLLVRKGRRIQLTPAGQVLYHYAKRIQNLMDQASEAVQELGRPGQGEIHVGAVSTVALSTLPTVLSTFTQAFPGVRVHVHIGEIQQTLDGVIRGELALAIITVPMVHPQVDSIPLFSDPVRLVVAPSRLAQLPSPLGLADLSNLDFISYQNPSRFRSFVDGVLEQHGVIARVLMEFNSHEVVTSMVKVGLGVAMVPDSVVRQDIAQGDLISLDVAGLPPIQRTTSLVVAKDPHRSHPLTALMRTVFDRYHVPAALWPPWYQPVDAP
ncbi:MAG: LysR family transcriptional regulator [Firmicutes bacterium]|jgi:DNA-binding transcriptional LysR family regulator|nr:LysR family transcriptional regulator [Bacillota bacterium]MCL5066630.1 LysR family transcriptional regulator [Bacillota bacterium]